MAASCRHCLARRAPTPGLAVVALLAAIMAVVLLALAGWQAHAATLATGAADARRSAALALASERLRDWYRGHLAELDTPGGLPPDPAAALAGEPRLREVQVDLGALASDGEVLGRPVRAWMRSDPGGAGSAAVAVDGRALEREAMRSARAQLAGLARRFEAWYAARIAIDPLHRLDRDWYRPVDAGCLALAGELPCLSDWTAAGSVASAAAALGVDAAAFATPWGDCCPVELDNGLDQGAGPPYTLALRVRTPWNQALLVQAVQPDGG